MANITKSIEFGKHLEGKYFSGTIVALVKMRSSTSCISVSKDAWDTSLGMQNLCILFYKHLSILGKFKNKTPLAGNMQK